MTKVAVALSGGVDSAVVAKLLIEQGYEVIGITGKMTCSEDADIIVNNAKKVADKLGIKHFVLDVSAKFQEKIIKYFETSYKNGETPNPCIMCNKHIKWGELFDYAINDLGADFIATGHYANIINNDGTYKLYPASDEHKDQLYFLFLLTQEHLAKTMFPLSNYQKEQVKQLAEKYDLPPKSSKESQDICFIKAPMTTKKYLNNTFKPQTGNFIQKLTGKILGKHDGYWQYTIGQRKGIGIAAPEPLYVLDIEPKSNTVFVGYKDELFVKTLELKNIQWNVPISEKDFDALVKIRYNMNSVLANIKTNSDSTIITFKKEVSGLTPGQACVIYDLNDGFLLGGAFIYKT